MKFLTTCESTFDTGQFATCQRTEERGVVRGVAVVISIAGFVLPGCEIMGELSLRATSGEIQFVGSPPNL